MQHLEIRDLWLQKEVSEGKVEVSKVRGDSNPADLMTKVLGVREIESRLRSLAIRVVPSGAGTGVRITGSHIHDVCSVAICSQADRSSTFAVRPSPVECAPSVFEFAGMISASTFAKKSSKHSSLPPVSESSEGGSSVSGPETSPAVPSSFDVVDEYEERVRARVREMQDKHVLFCDQVRKESEARVEELHDAFESTNKKLWSDFVSAHAGLFFE